MIKKIAVIAALLLPVLICSASLRPAEEPEFKNLKILPKNISHEELDKVMDEFKTALGVRCGFCHAKKADDPSKLDFASDENHHKDIARHMMKMTASINKKYFKPKSGKMDVAMMKVRCITCHNGEKEPKSGE
ncbi:MAG: c-type cytochrome [Mucilaginibacter polytrichastri]|nr:c-type cytochrome [Mucilaginibacter polytrichastri]